MKPTLDELEGNAIKGRLDLEILMFKQGFMEDIEQRRETITLLSERYKLLTGHKYHYCQERANKEYD